MRSLQISVAGLLAHNEQRPVWWRPRHPLVAYCHIGYLLLANLYFLRVIDVDHWSLGQTVYLRAFNMLYLMSAVYHTLRPNEWLRFFDQLGIRFYIIAVAVPFVAHHTWCLALILVVSVHCLARTWREHSGVWRSASNYSLGLGIISSVLVLTVGRSSVGAPWVSEFTLLTLLAIIGFTVALSIFVRQKEGARVNVWGPMEWFHGLNWIPVSLMSYLVVTYVVI